MSVIARLERARLRDRRRRHLHRRASSTAARRWPPRPFDAHNYRRSLQELRLFRREFPHAIVTPGHDPEFYEQLESRYESSWERITSRRPFSSSAGTSPAPGRRPRVATSSWRSRLGASSTGKLSGSPNWTVTLGKRKPLPAPHAGRAVDRDRDDRRARFSAMPADPRFRLAQLAAARAAALGVDRAASRPGRGS